MSTPRLTASAVLAVALALTGCAGGGDDTATSGSGSAHGSGHSSTDSGGKQANDADVAFLSGMKPHHEQAVEMSEIVLAADVPAQVAALARQIRGAQAPEIEQIDRMLTDLGESTDAASHSGHHSAHGGMMSEADLTALRAAKGTQAARLYLQAMIEHHEGAIDASETELDDGTYEPARELARSIAQAQAEEIATMRDLLTQL